MSEYNPAASKLILSRALPLVRAYRHLAADVYEIPTVRQEKLAEADAVITMIEEALA